MNESNADWRSDVRSLPATLITELIVGFKGLIRRYSRFGILVALFVFAVKGAGTYSFVQKKISTMVGGSETRISFDSLRDKNLMQLKKLNIAIFPVRYNDKYYADALSSGNFTKLAYFSDICVGAIACRLEKKEGGIRIYIMTLGVLAPYRGLGIGSKLLKHSLDLGSQDPSIVEIYLHVQTNNEDAISFYRKFGFEITDTIKNYYTNIDPPDCYVLSKPLNSFSKPKSTS